ncbi:hypothetical protein diail_2413, partial [Diaporthe ilicicola]
MSNQQRRDHDAVREASRRHDPFQQRWPMSEEDLEACLNGNYDTNDDGESDESVDTKPP